MKIILLIIDFNFSIQRTALDKMFKKFLQKLRIDSQIEFELTVGTSQAASKMNSKLRSSFNSQKKKLRSEVAKFGKESCKIVEFSFRR